MNIFETKRNMRMLSNCLNEMKIKPQQKTLVCGMLESLMQKTELRVFQALLFNAIRKQNLRLNEQSLAKMHLLYYKKVGFKGLKQKRDRRKRDIILGRQVRLNFIGMHFKGWFDLVREAFEEHNDRKVADLLWKQHMFYRLKNGAKEYGPEVGHIYNLKIQEKQFWKDNSRRRGLRMLFKNMHDGRLNQLHDQFVRKVI